MSEWKKGELHSADRTPDETERKSHITARHHTSTPPKENLHPLAVLMWPCFFSDGECDGAFLLSVVQRAVESDWLAGWEMWVAAP